MSYDLQLADRIRRLVKGRPDVSEKEMFGGIAFLHRERMFLGIVKSELMVRVGPEGHDAAVALPYARQMDFTGRPMRGYVFVSAPGLKADEALAAWIDRGAAFVATLPEKKPEAGATAEAKAPKRKGAKGKGAKRKTKKRKTAKRKTAKRKTAKRASASRKRRRATKRPARRHR